MLNNVKKKAIAFSGGGIRSGATSAGVIDTLENNDILKDFNYVSTVSGGGYLYIPKYFGSIKTRLYNSKNNLNEFNKIRVSILSELIKKLILGLLIAACTFFYIFFIFILVRSIGMASENSVQNIIYTIIGAAIVPFYHAYKYKKDNTATALENLKLSTYLSVCLIFSTMVLFFTSHLSKNIDTTTRLLYSLSIIFFVTYTTITPKKPKNSPGIFVLRSFLNTHKTLRQLLIFLALLITAELLLGSLIKINNIEDLIKEAMKIISINSIYVKITIIFITMLISYFLPGIFLAKILSMVANDEKAFKKYKDSILALTKSINQPEKPNTALPTPIINLSAVMHGKVHPIYVVDEKIHTHLFDKKMVKYPITNAIRSSDLWSKPYSLMAISGAAIDHNTLSPGLLKLVASTLFTNLGLYVANPFSYQANDYHPIKKGYDFFCNWSNTENENTKKHIRISDGGHFENTGVFSLLSIEVDEIICFDASADSLKNKESLYTLIQKAREFLNISLEYIESSDCFDIYKIYYKNKYGILYYTHLNNQENEFKFLFEGMSSNFPNDSTMMQCYTTQLFDIYYHLGEKMVHNLVKIQASHVGRFGFINPR